MEDSKVLARAAAQLEDINESIAETKRNIELLQARSETKRQQDIEDLNELRVRLETDPQYSTEDIAYAVLETSDNQTDRFYENYILPLERQQAQLERLQQDKVIYEYFIEHNRKEG